MRFLVPDGPLEHVTRQLQGKDLQQLRTACRDLRCHPAILTRVHEVGAEDLSWFDASVDLPWLQRLPSLITIRVAYADSVSHAHHFSGLSNLRTLCVQVKVASIDLTPLTCLRSLCVLQLFSDHKLLNLGRLAKLQRLTRLDLGAETDELQLGQLKSLMRLGVSETAHVAEAVDLTLLTRLDLMEGCPITSAMPEALQHMQGMQALRTLVAHDGLESCMPACLQLTRLRTLFFDVTIVGLRLDFTSLPSLKLLALWLYTVPKEVIAPSITCLRLHFCKCDVTRAPSIVACGNLARLEATLEGSEVMVSEQHLPAQTISIRAMVGRGSHLWGQLGVEHRWQLELGHDSDHYLLP